MDLTGNVDETVEALLGVRGHAAAAAGVIEVERGQHIGFEPLWDRVLVRRVEAEAETVGGLIVPEVAKEKPLEGIVLAAGPGRVTDTGHLIPGNLKPGDRVLFGKYVGTEVRIKGEEFLILREDEIFGRVRG